ncbi:MAG: hypothetical protein RSC76_10315 [Oscillospiraceae bacterium]
MINFKELLHEEIKSVFLNTNEFGEEHMIDGKSMIIIVDDMEVIERGKRQIDSNRIDGVYKKQILIYVTRNEFGALPAIGRQLKMDRGLYRVMDASEEGGIFSITLGAIKS